MAITPQQPPQPPRAMTDAERDNALYYHENRLDDLNGVYVPNLQTADAAMKAKINAQAVWQAQVKTILGRIGVVVPTPPSALP